MHKHQVPLLVAFISGLIGVSACTPTVNVKSEPIEINMNVKIQHEVRIKVDKELEEVFENEALF